MLCSFSKPNSKEGKWIYLIPTRTSVVIMRYKIGYETPVECLICVPLYI